MKKAFFGGSFDPPHYGHLGVAKAALASGRCESVVWFPAASPPHKQNSERAEFIHRMNMVSLLIDGISNMSVSDFENRINITPSYTINILEALEASTHEKYILLIGADSLMSLHTWHRADELVKKTEFICYPRAGTEVSLEKLYKHWDRNTAEKLFNSVIDGTFFKISSTEMKNSMEKNAIRGHIIREDLFPPQIENYIREHRLYYKTDSSGKGTL